MKLQEFIISLDSERIADSRKEKLHPIIDYIEKKVKAKQRVDLNFICTHNSRRSHLSQIWAQIMADYFEVPNVYCYSGGTEATALFPQIIKSLEAVGILFEKLNDDKNPIYWIRYRDEAPILVGFSKKYDHFINPKQSFAAVMTCNDADKNCPMVHGCEKRFSLNYIDPKESDNTPKMEETYAERSREIATEMKYIFSKIHS